MDDLLRNLMSKHLNPCDNFIIKQMIDKVIESTMIEFLIE